SPAHSESLLELNIPKPTFDIGKRFVEVVFERASHKWRIFIEHVLHSKGKRRAVEPGAPSTGIVLGSRNGQDVLLLAIRRLHVFTAILGEARHLRSVRRRQIKRVRRDQVERNPRRDFARKRRLQASVGIWDRIAVLVRYKFALRSRRLPLDGKAFCLRSRQKDIVIFVLAGYVNRGTNIETSEPGISRAVIERADK